MNYKYIEDYMDDVMKEYPEYDNEFHKLHFAKLFKKALYAIYELANESFNVEIGCKRYIFYDNIRHELHRTRTNLKSEYAKRKQLCKGVRVGRKCLPNS